MAISDRVIKLNLRAKFIFFISAFLIVFVAAITTINIKTKEEILTHRLLKKAVAMVSLLEETVANPLILLNVKEIELILQNVLEQEEVLYAYVFDQDGRIFTDGSGKNRFRHQILNDPVSRNAVAAETALSQFESDVLDVTKPIYVGSEKLGGVRIGFSLENIQKEINSIRNRNLLLGTGFVMLGIFLTFVLAQTVTRPLDKLIEGTESVSRGEFDKKIDISTNDELEVLADSFNQMMENLEKTTVSRDYVDNILRSMNDALIVVSPQGKVQTVNAAACTLLGYEEGELIGQSIGKVLGDESPLGESGLNDLTEKDFIQNVEKTCWTKDGRKIPVLLSSSVMPDGGGIQGRDFSIVCLARDITERKQIEEARRKELFLREIHHRIKNNLQIISTLLDLESKSIEDKQALEMLKESQNRIKSIAFIHEKLYESENPEKIDFPEYIRDLADYLLRSYGVNANAVELKINVSPASLGLDAAIPCGFIINELVSNSFEHAFPPDRAHNQQGEFKDEIRVDLHSETDGKFILIVGDNGIGFPKNLDLQNTKSFGLKLVTALVKQQLKGTIDVTSNGGTEFRIVFTEKAKG